MAMAPYHVVSLHGILLIVGRHVVPMYCVSESLSAHLSRLGLSSGWLCFYRLLHCFVLFSLPCHQQMVPSAATLLSESTSQDTRSLISSSISPSYAFIR